jgi:hypothetical protein
VANWVLNDGIACKLYTILSIDRMLQSLLADPVLNGGIGRKQPLYVVLIGYCYSK